METHQEKAFKEVIPDYITEMMNRGHIGASYINTLKRKIKKKLPNPNVSIFKKDIAKFILQYQIEQGEIKNKEDFINFYNNFMFITENLENIELETISDSLLIEEEDDTDDDINLYDQESLQYYYLKDDPDWFLELGLKEHPFPSQDGLYLISEDNYESVVLKTSIYSKYMEILEQDPKLVLNMSSVIYGDFGCGKTTFFDYLAYHLLFNNIQPIRIILNAKPSLTTLHKNFNESLFHELADYISKYSEDPRGRIDAISQYTILSLFNKIQEERDQIGFVIFLDGLHKSQDQKSTALNFLIELQNILEFYRRKEILLTIFIAGSLEWRDKINNSKKFSGSIYTLDKMDALNVTQAYEMLKRRFAVFSNIKGKKYIDYYEVELLITSIERSLAAEVTYRILIKYFLQNGFIYRNKIKLKPSIEEDVLNNIYEAIKNNRFLFKYLNEMKKKFKNDVPRLSRILQTISVIYDQGYIHEDHKFYLRHTKEFEILLKLNITQKSQKYKKKNLKPHILHPIVFDTFKDIENKIKFRPTHYMKLLFLNEPRPIENKAEYLNILDTIKRFKENNPEHEKDIEKLIKLTEESYFSIIHKIEASPNFFISDDIIKEMHKITEGLLRFLYLLSEELFPSSSQLQIFEIFKFTWLDNRYLTQYFNWTENWKANVNNKQENLQFLKLFIDTYEALIFKIGKHLLYNNFLVVGSKYLNDNEKVELNSARAFFSSKEYKSAVENCHNIIEHTLREFIYNILHLKYGKDWEDVLPTQEQNYIKRIKKKRKETLWKYIK
ncbi:MAG: hypothetical protein ACTSR8_04995 [Promethearchaeota archaeon]